MSSSNSSPNLARLAFALRPPQTEGMGRGFVFALAAHALLVLGLSAGVAWRTHTPPAFEAELWASVPVAAAPREQEPPPPPPEEAEPPKPQPKPQAQPEPDPQVEREAEIALAKEREKKLMKQREDAELERKRLAEQEAKRREELKKKEEALKEAKAREEKAKKDKAEKAERAKAEAAAKKAEAQADAKREAQRQENLRRIQGMAGASGAPNATGTALQSAGPSSSYAGRIKARVRPNIIYTDSGPGNPLAEVEVRVLPDGTIADWRLVKPSGNVEWDKAVLRAIAKTETLPRDTDGRVPPVMVLAFQPRE